MIVRKLNFTNSYSAYLLILALIIVSACSSNSKKDTPEPVTPIAQGSEESLLNDAEEMYEQGLYSVARDYWNQFLDAYPNSDYASVVELKIADSFYFAKQLPEAASAYEEFIRLHPQHEAVPYAQLQIGNAYIEQYEGLARDQGPLLTAEKNYKKVIAAHPTSEYAALASRKTKDVREQLAQHEAFVLKFYVKQGQEAPAVNRLQRLLSNYPETTTGKQIVAELREEFPEQTQVVLNRLRKDEAAASVRARLNSSIEKTSPTRSAQPTIKESDLDLNPEWENSEDSENELLPVDSEQ